MDYISVKEASELWGIDTSNLGKLLRKGKIEGAKIVGKSWLIPKNAEKPIDGRTKTAKESKPEAVFRFPLYINFPVESYSPPLSKEESTLRQAQVDFYNCEYEKSKTVFEELCKNADNIYVKICAHFFMCVLSAVFDINISWEKHYYGITLLLSEDIPRKKEMELFLIWLDYIIGQIGKIPEKLNTDAAYEYHPSAWYMNAFLSAFNYDGNTPDPKCTEPFVTLCRLMERDGYYVEAQEMHFLLFISHYIAHNEELADYHLRRAVSIVYEHNLIFSVANATIYYADAVNAVLSEYPDSFAERIHKNCKIIIDNFSKFAKKASISNIYDRLSKSDYRYVFYAYKGYANKQIASICGVSERTVANRYYEIYNKLGINSKQELINQIAEAFATE